MISQDENHKMSCDSVQDHKMSCDFTDCTCTLLWSLTHVLKTSYCIRKTSIVFWFWTFRVARMVLPMVNNHSAPIVCQLCDSILWYHKRDPTCEITRCILWFYKGLAVAQHRPILTENSIYLIPGPTSVQLNSPGNLAEGSSRFLSSW